MPRPEEMDDEEDTDLDVDPTTPKKKGKKKATASSSTLKTAARQKRSMSTSSLSSAPPHTADDNFDAGELYMPENEEFDFEGAHFSTSSINNYSLDSAPPSPRVLETQVDAASAAQAIANLNIDTSPPSKRHLEGVVGLVPPSSPEKRQKKQPVYIDVSD